jgi:hypothetical protein
MIFRKELQNLRQSSGFPNVLSFCCTAWSPMREPVQYGNAYKEILYAFAYISSLYAIAYIYSIYAFAYI